ncbi:YbaB/EbfC family nucleoid-associated protein [Sphingomicrobium clamense]|uniref:Nucleoid-associated protein KTQ36_07495 n=1 Tax=Sphingomicrobium clamense TaxID=2851013 RepID=A0ABS6V6E4_9SPHN|nr:YbaB/EbfC family nucleoid-associated protein [Sphingomicrobium sp. B8]MBW0145138.1 YbaB/EbfC family nucleoid-associated protein [Sphingomicrobium sp. B8]
MAGPSIEDIMAMAQKAQEDLQKAQDELGKIEVEGAAGGGLVKVRATAKGQINGVEIDDSLMKPEDKGMLEDLVAAAINDARMKADQAAAEEMKKATSGMPLPPGMKMPF